MAIRLTGAHLAGAHPIVRRVFHHSAALHVPPFLSADEAIWLGGGRWRGITHRVWDRRRYDHLDLYPDLHRLDLLSQAGQEARSRRILGWLGKKSSRRNGLSLRPPRRLRSGLFV